MSSCARCACASGEDVVPCGWCGGFADRRAIASVADADGGARAGVLCPICRDPRRESGLLCVVGKYEDMLAVEATGTMKGRYFILGTLVSVLADTQEELPVERLRLVLREQDLREIILATPPSVDGDATALMLRSEIVAAGTIKITRIATGLAQGSDLEFADITTLGGAMSNRRDLT